MTITGISLTLLGAVGYYWLRGDKRIWLAVFGAGVLCVCVGVVW